MEASVRHTCVCVSTLAPALQGRSYRGTQNFTRSGHTCRRWDAAEAVADGHTASRFPAAGLRDNFCRNPSDEEEVWCYVHTAGGPRREVCGVPLCDDGRRTTQLENPTAAPDVRREVVTDGDDGIRDRRMAAIIGTPWPGPAHLRAPPLYVPCCEQFGLRQRNLIAGGCEDLETAGQPGPSTGNNSMCLGRR